MAHETRLVVIDRERMVKKEGVANLATPSFVQRHARPATSPAFAEAADVALHASLGKLEL
jgi:hypothetical protein